MTNKRKAIIGFAVIFAIILGLIGWRIWPMFQAPEALDVGIAVGETAPVGIELRDASGNPTTLSDQMGANGAVVVMVRSADWCPFCKLQLMDHSKIADDIEERGYNLVSLSYDEPAVLADFAADMDRPFTLLSDTESLFIDGVGLRDPAYGPDHHGHGVPHASILVLAPEGTVQAKFVTADYRQRPGNEFVLDMIDSTGGD